MGEKTRGRDGFDPRFDPAFQPGYDPAAGSAIPGRQFESRSPDAPAQAAPSAGAGLAATEAGPRHPLAGAPVPWDQMVGHPPEGSLSVQDAPVPEAAEEVPAASAGVRQLARNPFVIALWSVSGVFVLAGAGFTRLLTQAGAALNTSSSPAFDFFLVSSLVFAAPLLIVLGFATATATLFLFAVRWRGRP